MLEREAESQRHAHVPGGGVRVARTDDLSQADEQLSGRARLEALTGQRYPKSTDEETNVPLRRGMPAVQDDRGW